MSAEIVARGRLGQDPKAIQTKTGKPMTRASMAVSGATQGDTERTLWLSLVAFGKVAEHLLRFRKGDILTATGRLELNHWTNAAGEEKESLQCVCEQIIGARPKPREQKDAGAGRDFDASHRHQQPEFNDDIAF